MTRPSRSRGAGFDLWREFVKDSAEVACTFAAVCEIDISITGNTVEQEIVERREGVRPTKDRDEQRDECTRTRQSVRPR